MWEEPTREELSQIPALRATRETPVDDRIIYLHFMLGGIDWYVVEFDGEDTFYGHVDYHDPINEPEWQYFSFSELKNERIHNAEVILDPYTGLCAGANAEQSHEYGSYPELQSLFYLLEALCQNIQYIIDRRLKNLIRIKNSLDFLYLATACQRRHQQGPVPALLS